MIETMGEYDGIGLAAPQVHESVRLFVAGLEEEDERTARPRSCRSPSSTPRSRPSAATRRGLGRLPEHPRHPRARCRAPRAIVVRALDRDGEPLEMELKNFPARVVQHENDHLDGVLFFDRMKSFETLAFLDEFSRFWAKDTDELRRTPTDMERIAATPRRRRRRWSRCATRRRTPFDGAIAAARTCYSPRVVSAGEITDRQRDTIGTLTFDAGHHTVYQHAHFEFGLENISRQFVWTRAAQLPVLQLRAVEPALRQAERAAGLRAAARRRGARRLRARDSSRRGTATPSCRRCSRTIRSAILKQLRYVTPRASAERLKAHRDATPRRRPSRRRAT